MSFANAPLLFGVLAAAVPIVLHLVMRQQPRRLEFPALRFIQKSREANRRRLKLRHLLLLALRAGGIAVLAAALAGPRIKLSGGLADQEAPVAVALIFDTSPRMAYRQENKTRLEAAQETCLWLLSQLPAESQVAVLDSGRAAAAFQIDMAAARDRVTRLETTGISRPLADSVQSAAELLVKSELGRKEIYLFTDLAKSAWSTDSPSRWQQGIAQLGEIGIYVIDVGATEPHDVSLGPLRLSGQVLARNSPLSISAEVSCLGPSAKKTVELYLVNSQGKPEKKGEESVAVSPTAAASVSFRMASLELGTHQGYVRIVGEDSLPADDVRYFTVAVESAWRVLVAAPTPAEKHAYTLTEMLAPERFRQAGLARFECDVVEFDRLPTVDWDKYDAFCLLDPPPLSDAAWQLALDFAKSGGGIAVFLGPNARPEAFQSSPAQELLPGTLSAEPRQAADGVHLTTSNDQHPILARFRSQRGTIPWEDYPVYRYWAWDKLAEGVSVIVPYSDGQPALVEKPLGKGRLLLLTTPLSEPPDVPDRDRWNLLTGLGGLPTFVLTNEMLLYLVGSGDHALNYAVGSPATLRVDSTQRHSTYLVTTPRGDSFRQPADSDERTIVVASTNWPGNYRIRAGGERGGVDRGFSANLPSESTNLQRISQDELRTVMGKTPFRVARSREEIRRDVNLGRVGRELFPLMILLVTAMLGAEHFLANRFYRARN